jgi:hypothetical protein
MSSVDLMSIFFKKCWSKKCLSAYRLTILSCALTYECCYVIPSFIPCWLCLKIQLLGFAQLPYNHCIGTGFRFIVSSCLSEISDFEIWDCWHQHSLKRTGHTTEYSSTIDAQRCQEIPFHIKHTQNCKFWMSIKNGNSNSIYNVKKSMLRDMTEE